MAPRGAPTGPGPGRLTTLGCSQHSIPHGWLIRTRCLARRRQARHEAARHKGQGSRSHVNRVAHPQPAQGRRSGMMSRLLADSRLRPTDSSTRDPMDMLKDPAPCRAGTRSKYPQGTHMHTQGHFMEQTDKKKTDVPASSCSPKSPAIRPCPVATPPENKHPHTPGPLLVLTSEPELLEGLGSIGLVSDSFPLLGLPAPGTGTTFITWLGSGAAPPAMANTGWAQGSTWGACSCTTVGWESTTVCAEGDTAVRGSGPDKWAPRLRTHYYLLLWFGFGNTPSGAGGGGLSHLALLKDHTL